MRSLWLLLGALNHGSLAIYSGKELLSADSVLNSTSGLNGTDSTNLLSTSDYNVSIIGHEIVPAYRNSTSSFNESNRAINFQNRGYSFKGRTFVGTNIAPDVRDVATFLKALKSRFDGMRAESRVAISQELYWYHIKLNLQAVDTYAWKVADLQGALSILVTYFERYPSHEEITMSIGSSTGSKASIDINRVLTEIWAYSYQTPGSPTQRSRMDLWIYPEDVLDNHMAEECFVDAEVWADGHGLHNIIPPNTNEVFVQDKVGLQFTTTPAGQPRGRQGMVYDELVYFMREVERRLGRTGHTQYTNFLAFFSGEPQGPADTNVPKGNLFLRRQPEFGPSDGNGRSLGPGAGNESATFS